MVWKRKTYRKTYRRKRAYKKRRTWKKRKYSKYSKYTPSTRPFDSRKEDELLNVTFTAAYEINTHPTAASGSTFAYIYWACSNI